MPQSLLKLPCESIKQQLRLSLSLRLRRQVYLDFAAVEENCRLGILVLRIDWRDFFVNSGLAHSSDSKDTTNDAHIPCFGSELRLHERPEHWLHLTRWTGQEHNASPIMLKIHSGRSSLRVIQNFSALDDHRLTGIYLRHLPPHF